LEYRQNESQVYRGGGALHTIAMLTAGATFPLIFMGGLVTSKGAGMSVPDWPNSYGYNMFLFPPSLWIGDIFYEHTHRLMGTVVGFLSIAMVVAACLTRGARRERWIALAVLVTVCIQGVLGGQRVVLVNLTLAIVHGCTAQAFFCLTAFAALATTFWWKRARPVPVQDGRGRGLVWLGLVATTAIFGQLIVGALMRHYQAGLAIPDLPLAYGKLLPPTTQSQLDAINWLRMNRMDLGAVTLGQIWLHFGHRMGAILVSGLIIALAGLVLTRYRTQPRLVLPAGLLLFLLSLQLALGVLTVLLRKPADVASLHVAVGALVLVTTFVLTCSAIRLYGISARSTVPMGSNIGLAPAH
jgi:cytochrome c oxidase assembly protein subunit 15